MSEGWLHTFVETHALDPSWRRVISALDRRHLRPMASGPARAGARGAPARVSVVIPCFNYGRYLPAAVASALDQDGVDVEVLVVDDASTDGSGEVADSLAAADARVRVLHNDANSGHVVTFNNGLAAVTGEFVVRLDADDLLTPGCLERAVALFRAVPSVGLVYGHPRHFLDDDVPPARERELTWTVWHGVDWFGERCRTGVNCITTPEAMVRRSVIDDIGPLNTELRFAQDMEMWCRVATVSDVGHVAGADQALHRDHAGSMSVTDGAPLLVDLEERATVFRVVGESMGERVPAIVPMVAKARSALATEALRAAQHLIDRHRAEPGVVEDLLEFARDLHPSSRTSAKASVVTDSFGRAETALARAAGVVRAASHRVGYEAAFLRWTVRGL
ncbi:glycosyltransferase family 2 protein [Cellulomonas sp. ICMP 17802]|uniref:glycosyltransferase family 2 protein n=1 Tax=Cellulomonas sp. ICMP 17802 TaxID=3239199 RepID=UPI00351BA9A3